MKGLTHFISGIAAASFIPSVVQRCAVPRTGLANADGSFLLALAGLYGIMPDTLDFKFGRFFETADVDVFPDQLGMKAQAIADILGQTMDRAYEANRPQRIQFHPVRISADRWYRYEIKFDAERQEVMVVIHDIVTTSQVPFPGTAPPDRVGLYRLRSARLIPGNARDTTVDIMSGPMYGFKRMQDKLLVDFLPWHRTWSHSYVVGLICALPLWLIGWLAGWPTPWLYTLVAWIGFATHVTEDLTGHMGGSLIWPIVKDRCRGLGWFHAANADSNFVTSYLAAICIIFNLDRFGPRLIPLASWSYFAVFFTGPILLYFLPRLLTIKPKPLIRKRREGDDIVAAYRAKRSLEEIEEESATI